jgi:hypothetical protein
MEAETIEEIVSLIQTSDGASLAWDVAMEMREILEVKLQIW